MGVRTVTLLRSLQDRPLPDRELSCRLRATPRDIALLDQKLAALRAVGLIHHHRYAWALTRKGRQLLEVADQHATPPRQRALAHMMRDNRGLTAA